MAPKAKKQDALRAEIEERLCAQAERDDLTTRQQIIEKRLIEEAEAADAATEAELKRLAEIERQRQAELERQREEARARRRLQIEAKLIAAAKADDAAEDARREAIRLAQEKLDLAALAETLLDEQSGRPRAALTACWDEISRLYSGWGAATIRPGALVCGATLAKADVCAVEVRQLVARLRGIGGAAGQADEAELRLLNMLLKRGGYSEQALQRDQAILAKVTEAIATTAETSASDAYLSATVARAASESPRPPFAPKWRPQPPSMRSRAPAWRQAPSRHALSAVPGGYVAPTLSIQPRALGRANSLHCSSPQGTAFRRVAMYQARHDPRFSNWPSPSLGGPASSVALKLRAPQFVEGEPPAEPAPRLQAAGQVTRPTSAAVAHGYERAATLPRCNQSIPRPSSAPPSISTLVRSEMRSLVYAL